MGLLLKREQGSPEELCGMVMRSRQSGSLQKIMGLRRDPGVQILFRSRVPGRVRHSPQRESVTKQAGALPLLGSELVA